MSTCLSKSGGKLSLLRKVSEAAGAAGGDEASAKAKTPKFDTRKQFRLTS